MEKFNIKRFWQVLMRLLMVRKKAYVSLFLALIILFTLTSIFVCNPFSLEYIGSPEMTIKLVQGLLFCLLVADVVLLICGTFIVSDLRSKQDKISEMMLPATNLEKFTARFIGSTLFIVILIIVAYIIGDGLQQLINMMIHKGAHASVVSMLWEQSESFRYAYDIENTAELSAGLLTAFAIATLGGMIFRKTAWLKTAIAAFLIVVIGFSLFVGFAYLVYTYTDYVVIVPRHIADWQTGIICTVVIAACLFFSYRLYCRLQAVNNKWINI